MKSKVIITAIIIFNLHFSICQAQDIYTPVLTQIEQNSSELRALRQRADAEVAANHTGLAPANPTVEAGHLWGVPSEVGPRIDFAVRQEFDFPTVYVWQRRLAAVRDSSAEYQYRYGRQQLLLAAKQACIRLIYGNALVSLCRADAERARLVAEAYDKMLQQGSATQLESNRARLGLTTAETALATAEMERDRCRAELQSLNGGVPIAFDHSDFPVAALPTDTAIWLSSMLSADPMLATARSESNAAQSSFKLTRSKNLPRWSVGYMGEFVEGNTFHGITFGLSLPIWQNTGRVRQARLAAQATETQTAALRERQLSKRQSQLREALRLSALATQIESSLPIADADLLHRAFLAGELPLTDYLIEQSLLTTAHVRRLATLRDFHILMSELNVHNL